jgi:dolichyl-diphosphooligosaccharide--protein glycosyltransferase
MSTISAKIRARLSRKAIYGIALLIIFGIALALRVSLPYESVFTGDGVIFGGTDPWYHMRLVENLVQHFPHLIAFDPFTLFPYGQDVPFAPFFDLLLGFLIWVIGLGSPTQHTIETVGAYFPAILGALVTVPVYLIGRELFNRNIGLLSAALIAILPGQYFLRSLLGFTDHHIAEVLFTATAALFLILAIKRARERETSFSHIRSRDWGNFRKPLIYALLAGLALGIYLISWSGGLLFVFIIFAYIVIQYIIDHLRGRSTDYLCIIGVPMFLIALIIVIPFLNFLTLGGPIIASLTISMLTLLVLSGISRLMDYGKLRRAYYILVLAGLALAGVGVFYAVDPSLLSSMVGRFSIFIPSTAAKTIGEVSPLLSITGFFRTLYFFTIDIFLALIALGLIIRAQVRDGNAEKTFLIVWSIIMLLAMLGQNRFAYYFAVNVALLTGYMCWRILVWSYVREALPEGEKGEKKVAESKEPESPIIGHLSARYPWVANVVIITGYLSSKIPEWLYFSRTLPEGEKGKKKVAERKETGRPSIGYLSARHARVAGVAMMVFLIAILPNIVVAVDVARDTLRPNEAQYSSLVWMRENTPDPFEDPDFYYEVYEKPPSGERYDYPESAYGVMNFWDYGHWITRIAHRIPSANPFQAGAVKTARFFTAQDESLANEVLDELGSGYVIVDYGMATEKFYGMPIWAGEDQSQFIEEYQQELADGVVRIRWLFYPEYYQSMHSRLYNFNGEAVVPHNSTLVISYEEKSAPLRGSYKEISSTQYFATYEEALEYLESQTASNYRIVGEDPFISPVPLEELEHYQLVHPSDPEVLTKKKVEPIPYVKIFEYIP